MGNNESGSHWISLSDMMTGLMLFFLLISILVIYEVKILEDKVKKNEENKNNILKEYDNTKDNILNDLKNTFGDKQKEWEFTIDDDLTLKFTNPDVLFEPDSNNIREGFKKILDDFIPKYLDILNSEEYKNKIKEIRIEGHAGKCLDSEYMECLLLSQTRANSVLKYIYDNNYFKNLKQEDKSKFKFLFTSNGMSDGKNLDSNGEYIYYSKNELDSTKSRRVEFRIVSNSEELVDDLIKEME